MSVSREPELLVRFDNLARAVRAWSDREEATDEGSSVPAWLVDSRGGASAARKRAIVRGLPGARTKAGLASRRRLLTVTVGATAAVVALMLVRGFGTTERHLSFVVGQGNEVAQESGVAAAETAGPEAAVAPAPAGAAVRAETGAAGSLGGARSSAGTVSSGAHPARISFSDGSAIVLQPGARGTVVKTTDRGARVRVETGRARVSVAHLPGAEWSVEAGPFVVVVHGTVFDVSWSQETGALSVDLIAGAVTVEGPRLGFGSGKARTALRAGERLIARASTGEARVESLAVPTLQMRGAPPPTEAEPPNSADAATAGIDGGARRESPSAPASRGPQRRGGAVAAERALRSQGSGPSVAAHSAAVVAESASVIWAAWSSRVAAGSFQSVVADADALGIERCLAQAPASSLGALADAARYVRRTDLARQALLAKRRRFAGSSGAHDAAFLIGRLAEDMEGDDREALVWYDRYLEEDDHGTYAAEALGRKMLTLDRLGEEADARSTAARYLQRYPAGAFANRATRLQSPQ